MRLIGFLHRVACPRLHAYLIEHKVCLQKEDGNVLTLFLQNHYTQKIEADMNPHYDYSIYTNLKMISIGTGIA